MSVAALLGVGCAGDVSMVSGDDTGSTTGAETTSDVPTTITLTTADSSGGSTGDVDTGDSESSGLDTTDDTTASDTGTDDATTGGDAIPGQTVSQNVASGVRTTSATYTLVYTFGQPSQLQSTHQSATYRIQGGLAGANGSPP